MILSLASPPLLSMNETTVAQRTKGVSESGLAATCAVNHPLSYLRQSHRNCHFAVEEILLLARRRGYFRCCWREFHLIAEEQGRKVRTTIGEPALRPPFALFFGKGASLHLGWGLQWYSTEIGWVRRHKKRRYTLLERRPLRIEMEKGVNMAI